MTWKLSYSILSTPRQEPYLKRTLESLEETGFFKNQENLPVRLVAGSPEPEYFDEFRDDERFFVEDMSFQEAEGLMFSIAGVALRATWGHYRCLHYDRVNSGSAAVMVMEDDIKFSQGWERHLHAAIDEISCLYGARWVLSLYTPHSKGPLEAFQSGKKWMARDYQGFYGAQAIVYPLGVRDSYMAYLAGHPLQLPHDLALPEVMKALKIPLLTTAPCLVQHMGKVKQGVSSGHHVSDSFLDTL